MGRVRRFETIRKQGVSDRDKRLCIYKEDGYYVLIEFDGVYYSIAECSNAEGRKKIKIFYARASGLNSVYELIPRRKRDLQQTLERISDLLEEEETYAPIHWATRLNLVEYFRRSLKKNEINEQTPEQQVTPLHLAIHEENEYLILEIFKLHPDLTIVDKDGCNMMHYAAVANQTRVIKFLLCLHVDFRRLLLQPNYDDVYPILLACLIQKPSNVLQILGCRLTVAAASASIPQRDVEAELRALNESLRKVEEGGVRSRPHSKKSSKKQKSKKGSKKGNEKSQKGTSSTSDGSSGSSSSASDQASPNLQNIQSIVSSLRIATGGTNSREDKIIQDRKTSTNEASQLPIVFSAEMLGDLDHRDMRLGGSPLHWVKTRRTAAKLGEMKFDVMGRNFIFETPAHVAIRNYRLKVLIIMLSYGADPNARDDRGDTILHAAVRANDISAVQAAVVFNTDLNAVNLAGETALHMASRYAHRLLYKDSSYAKMIYILHSVGAKRCLVSPNECHRGCEKESRYAGYRWSLWPVMHNEALFSKTLFSKIIEDKMNIYNHPNYVPRRRILCCDGGGVRGLISTQMLIELEKALGRPLWQYFDWYSGTSTGSLIALWLAQRFSLDELRGVYFLTKDHIFAGPKPYDHRVLEALAKEVSGGETVRMRDLKGAFVTLTATIANRTVVDLKLFRNYASAREILKIKEGKRRRYYVWEAVRSSTAAPIYFGAYEEFMDGGLIANNPTIDTVADIQRVNAAYETVGKLNKRNEIDLVVSLGTGKSMIFPGEMKEISFMSALGAFKETLSRVKYALFVLLNLVCISDGFVVDRAQAWLSSLHVPYFRLNNPMSSEIQLDELDEGKLINAMWEATSYMRSCKKDIETLRSLMSKPRASVLMREAHGEAHEKPAKEGAGKVNIAALKVFEKGDAGKEVPLIDDENAANVIRKAINEHGNKGRGRRPGQIARDAAANAMRGLAGIAAAPWQKLEPHLRSFMDPDYQRDEKTKHVLFPSNRDMFTDDGPPAYYNHRAPDSRKVTGKGGAGMKSRKGGKHMTPLKLSKDNF